MSFGANSSSKKSSEKDTVEHDYKKVGSIWRQKEYKDRFTAVVDNYFGDLIFKQVVKNEAGDQFQERYFKLKYLSLFTPRIPSQGAELPERLQYNLVVDLKNPNAVEFVGETDWQPLESSQGGDGQEQDEG